MKSSLKNCFSRNRWPLSPAAHLALLAQDSSAVPIVPPLISLKRPWYVWTASSRITAKSRSRGSLSIFLAWQEGFVAQSQTPPATLIFPYLLHPPVGLNVTTSLKSCH